MRKKFLASLAGTLAVAGLALTLTTSSVAAPGTTAIHLGDVLPGALTDWGGVSGWVQANSAAITAQGYDHVAAADPTGGDCLTVTPASGAITVGPSCPTGMNVGSAVGDATGNLAMTFDKVQLTFPQGATLLTPAEALSLVPELTMTVNPDGAGSQPAEPRQYTVNIQTGTIRPASPAGAPGSDEATMDDIVVGQAAAIVDKIKTSTAPTLIAGLTDGLVNAFATGGLFWTTTISDPSFAVSFAYPFDGQLTNGVTARLAINKVLAGTMFDPFASPSPSSSIDSPLPLSGLTLSDVLPTGAPGQPYADGIHVGQQFKDSIKGALATALDQSTNGVWGGALTNLKDGINSGLAAINDTAPLAEVNPDFANTIDFDPIPSSAASINDGGAGHTDGVLITALRALTPTKTSEWLEVFNVNGPVKFAYESPKIQHLTPTGITVLPPTSDSPSSESASSEPATSEAPTTQPPTSSEPPTTTAPSSSEALTSESSSSSAPMTSTPPSSSEAPTTSAPSSTEASSSAPSTPTQPSPTVPSTPSSANASASSASSATSPSATPPTTPSASQTVPSSIGQTASSTAPTTSASSSTKPSSSTPPTAPTVPSQSATNGPSTPASSASKSSTPAPTSATSSAASAPASSPASRGVTVTPNEAHLVTISGQDPQPVVLTIAGQGFLPGERVTGVMRSDPVALPDQTADAQGRVSFTWPLPADTPAGQHSIVLTGETTGPLPAGTFTVVRSESSAETASSAAPSASGKGLAGAGLGAATNVFGLLGLLATTLGGAALAFASRPSYRRASR